ncbi:MULTISPECIES: SOS response-associated peptidase family protein [unclassified Stenotrophomonas]|uniref:SOS response-associated peptidase family protein n=1 Tax=unclassified Stenotrophomonas TaxID=196198 RepID=UPI0021197D42|nr:MULTISPECIES: SOS response-associated peptidase family protein [unclassified Stenotrophomonas]
MHNGGLGTFTIITGDNSGVSADIHDQMPLWLQPGQVDDWMAAEPDDAMAMLLASEPHPHSMEACRVSRAVNSPSQQRRAAFAASVDARGCPWTPMDG